MKNILMFLSKKKLKRFASWKTKQKTLISYNTDYSFFYLYERMCRNKLKMSIDFF